MRRPLALALAVTGALSVWALLSDGNAPQLVAAVGRAAAGPPVAALQGYPQPATKVAGMIEIPAELPRLPIDPAEADPFAPAAVARQPEVAQAPSPVPNLAPAKALDPSPPPAPKAPAVQLRILGTIVTPAGQRLVYAARGERDFSVKAGDRLDDGYVVESVDGEKLTLFYPPADARVLLPIPKAPGAD